MNRACCFVLLFGCVTSLVRADELASSRLDNWHQWRGPLANGVAPKGDPPLRWDESTNIKWKVEIPGSGSSTPIVWDDRVFLTTAIKTDRGSDETKPKPAAPVRRGRRAMSTPAPTTFYQFVVLCFDRNTGTRLWKKVVTEQVPHAGHHPSHGYASASPTTDGRYIYASFGSQGLYCLDVDGNIQWQKDFGDMRTKVGFGEGTSPVLSGESLIINWDHEGESFIARLDAKTGDEIWRVDRDEGTSWATPLVVEHDGMTHVVTNATRRTRSYDLASGELIWQCAGQASNPIPSPLANRGIVYCMTGFRGFALFAVPLGARGDVTDSDTIAWQRSDGAPYVASAVIYENLLYCTKERRGILQCVDAATGEIVYKDQRLPEAGTIYASLVAAAGRIYVTNRNGSTFVIEHGAKYNVLATNQLDEGIDASPAIVGKQLFLRGQQHLYCIESGD